MYPFLLDYKLPERKENKEWDLTHCPRHTSAEEDPLSGTVRKGTLVG